MGDSGEEVEVFWGWIDVSGLGRVGRFEGVGLMSKCTW